MKKPIFVVGAARSGTVFMGQVLKAHPDVHCLIERPSVFEYATYLGLNPSVKDLRPNDVRDELRKLYSGAWGTGLTSCRSCSSVCRKTGGVNRLPWSTCYNGHPANRYADKSHQLVLSVPQVISAFPDAQFINLVRDGRDVVASMLRHSGVRGWFSDQYINKTSTWPQPWFGVQSQEHYEDWTDWSLARKSALRWVSWIEAGLRASKMLPNSQWLDIRYEDLVTDAFAIGERLFSWLDLQMDGTGLSEARDSSNGRWRERLTSEQIAEVESVAGSTLERLGYN